ncbi:MAG: dephospho-CoA kinase [Pyrinomonas sp.]|uniref:dephospho-CoA kinase n=1 Tax=Pyrinomonas sp. TaxID=2080306 RepID=UPI003327887E
MLRVGLTGSIAVGKSFVASVLGQLGCHVIDADEVARAVVAPGSLGLQAVVREFGEEVLRSDGSLDRARLAAIVFADAKRRARLNAILHPLIIAEQEERLKSLESEDPCGIAVVEAALIIEAGSRHRFDRLIVVHCRPEVQIERLMRRNRISREEAERLIAAQMPQEEKMRHADFLIDSSDGFDDVRRQTEEVYRRLRALTDACR